MQTTENFDRPELSVTLRPWFPSWVLERKGGIFCELMTWQNLMVGDGYWVTEVKYCVNATHQYRNWKKISSLWLRVFFLCNGSVRGEDLSFPASTLLDLSLKTQDVEKTHPKWELKAFEFCATSVSSYKSLNYSTPFLSNNNNNNNLFYQELFWYRYTFSTVISKYFTKRTQLPKRLPKSTQAFSSFQWWCHCSWDHFSCFFIKNTGTKATLTKFSASKTAYFNFQTFILLNFCFWNTTTNDLTFFYILS